MSAGWGVDPRDGFPIGWHRRQRNDGPTGQWTRLAVKMKCGGGEEVKMK
jgi:hypothetical protein